MMHVFFSITSFFKNNKVVQHTTDEITFFKTIMYTNYSITDLTYRPLLVLNEVKNDSDCFLLSYLNLFINLISIMFYTSYFFVSHINW